MKEQTIENKPVSVAGAGTTRLFPKQAGETTDRWSWVERSVWTERMLNRLAESQEQTVWFSLWDKVWNSDNLSQAMLEVTRTDGLKRKGSTAWKRPKRNGFNPERDTTDWKAEC